MTLKIVIHNLETNELENREMTKEEAQEYQKTLEKLKTYENEIANKKLIRDSALAKLAALGLTEDEIAAL